MTSTLACPDETELLALAMGEPVAAAVTAHVAGCASCQAQLDRFQAEVASLRQNHEAGPTPPSTEHDPAADHDGEPSDAGTTSDWTSADPAGAPGTDPFGPEAVAAARDRAEGQGALPDAIGRYKVVGWLGAGGEADVYRVVHIKLGNDLVLKLSRRRVGAENQSGLVEEGRLLVDLRASQPGPDLRPRLPRRPAVPGDGVRARPQPRTVRPRRARDPAPGGRAGGQAGGSDGRGPSAWDHPLRHQAQEYPDRQAWASPG